MSYRQHSALQSSSCAILRLDPSTGSRKGSNMSSSELAKLTGRLSLREEVLKAQQERSERTRKVVQEWFDRTRMPEHLRSGRQRDVSAFDKFSAGDE